MKNRFRILLTTCLTALALTAQAQEFLKLEGKILSAETKEPVPFASIGLPENDLGTVCDENGNFQLKIPNNLKNQEICVSALGYKQNCRPVSGFSGQNPTVLLEPANLELATVEIKALSATELVKEAIRRIPENYADKPVHYTFYLRQLYIDNDRPAYIIESVNEAFKKHPKNEFQATILKTRGKATSKKKQEEMNGAWVGVNRIQSFINVSTNRPYLQASKYKQYNYQFEPDDLIGKDTVYVISFKPKKKSNGQEIPGYEGKLFLHYRSKAIIRVEAKQNQASLDKENNSFLIQAANKVEKGVLEFQKDNLVLEYKKNGNRWYLNNVYSESFSQFTLNVNPIPDRSHIIRQLVVTNVQKENAQEIPEEQRAKRFVNLYNAAPKDMTEQYWQQYNVLPLPDAYKNAQEKTVGL